MTETIAPLSQVIPSATPTEKDIGEWQALPRDQQLARLRDRLTQGDGVTVSDATMSEILARAQELAKARRG